MTLKQFNGEMNMTNINVQLLTIEAARKNNGVDMRQRRKSYTHHQTTRRKEAWRYLD